MTKIRVYARQHARWLVGLTLALAALGWLLVHQLGSLSGGLSGGEVQAATAAVGWHGIYHDPFYLPLKLVGSVIFFLYPMHGQALTRLPNALFGGLTIISFTLLIGLWHSTRTALLTGLLFATSAWVMHVSRLASFDVMYLWAVPTLLLSNILTYRFKERAIVWYGCLIAMGLMLYIPGLIWLIILNLYFSRGQIAVAWQHFQSIWKRGLITIASLVWLPLLVIDLRRPGQLGQWLGWPAHLAGSKLLIKHFLGVPLHLFVRGPQYPDVWLGRSPILDIFALLTCVIGIYFYVTHLKATRSQYLLFGFIIGWLLIGLGGPVGLSLLVPILYVSCAAGIAYLLHEWLQVFPLNPLARSFGLSLVAIAVGLACLYNLRAYFVAWPHNSATQATFHYRR